MTEHTPGPWGLFKSPDGDFFILATVREERELTDTIGKAFALRGADCKANARLIAASPDLLEACKVALDAINLNDEKLTAREALEAAIAKARLNHDRQQTL